MLTHQNIKQTIAGKDDSEALAALDRMASEGLTDVEKALVLAEKGKIFWRRGERGEAISAYEQGSRLDPDGPAALLLAHSNSIMDFFNPDLLNP